ncbi:MAG TPA: PBP1A family penicillin-binding protein [Candidatus Saccharimonadales bacterium]|jgi:1A family penicillin-binding protein|nr:PBP1A family penicillin-binding protein [Candidatus Saccharimonadales bacterium]
MIKAIKRILILTGKPIYFVLSRLVIILGLLFYAFSRKGKKRKKIKSRIIYKRLSFPKVKLPKFKLPAINVPKISPKLKLEELKITLFELKTLAKFKKFFTRKLTRLQKLQLKISVRVIIICLAAISLVLYSYFAVFRGLPSPKELESRQPDVSTKIYDRDGNLLYKIYKDQNRTIVPLTRIPLNARLATLAAEDAEFYSNPGFSIKGTFRAIIQNIQTGSLQGGSTITQQLVKNTLLTPEKTITRKIKELILSMEVETTYTKDKILEMYLNEVSYGGTAYGIEEASESYFGKNVEDLDLAEAALLAGLPKSPTSYSPFGSNPDLAIQRQKEVLHLMVVNKFITQSQEQAAENEKLNFVSDKTPIKSPHFVMYIRQLLVDKYGEDMVEKGGLEVTTSLDLSIQETAEQVVQSEVAKLGGLHVGNGAALVVNPQTGEILAMVGSKNYFDAAYDGQVNVTTSLRQPGSSIKVVNYAYALSNGYTPATIIDDSPITYVTAGTTPYSPVNYDGQFRGPIPLRSALAQSRNIPAVKVLASYGVAKMITEGQKMGITTWTDPSDYGLSLTLGGGAVTALDLSRVYSTVANYGKRPDLLPILEVKDYKGKVLEKNSPTVNQEIDPRVAFLLTDILKDNNARAPEFGSYSYLVIKDHPEVAVKTGTSNDLRDNWTVGYNQNYLVLTWVGNNDNSPMSHVASGVTGASPIWNKIMSAILNNEPSIDWKVPDGVSKINICSITGTLPCDSCPTKQEWFLDETRPVKYCTPDQIQKIISSTPVPGGKILDNGVNTQITR